MATRKLTEQELKITDKNLNVISFNIDMLQKEKNVLEFELNHKLQHDYNKKKIELTKNIKSVDEELKQLHFQFETYTKQKEVGVEILNK